MEGSEMALLLGLFMCVVTCYAKDVSVACMMAYEEGGVLAVLNSLECPNWALPIQFSQTQLDSCQFATLQGRRKYQEDRMACNTAMKIPLLGKDGEKDVTFSVAAVFDGHGGNEASELASKRFLEYFFLHAVFNNYKQVFTHDSDTNQSKTSAESSDSLLPMDDTLLHQILEEALLRTFKDIDSEFSQDALENGYSSGSTGTVVILVNGQILFGQVGDSKAMLCSRKAHTDQDAEVRDLYAEELTRDHHPDREDEKARIEAAGGFVRWWGVPRVNGILAMSRSIGDVYLKRYGIIAEPEISWRTLNSADIYLIVASDGIFESLTPTDICDNLHDSCARDNATSGNSSSCLPQSSLAKHIVDTAFERGSTDNLSAILISLESAHFSQ